MNEARGGSKFLGRDHHPHCFTIWMAGAGIKKGATLGGTDELGYFITEGKMSVHDLQATILHLMGLDRLEAHVPLPGIAATADRPRGGGDDSTRNSGIVGEPGASATGVLAGELRSLTLPARRRNPQ